MAVKKLKAKNPKKPFITKLKAIAIISLMCYAIVVIVSQQVSLSAQRDKIKNINEKVSIAKQTNDEYLRLFNMTDQDDYLKMLAIEQGYAYPGETRVYDKN